MRNGPAARVGLALGLFCLLGCTRWPKIETTRAEGFALMPPGKTAVLKVTARPLSTSKSYQFLWGIVQVPNAPLHFAELLAYFAREEGGLDVIAPQEVERRLKTARLEPTLDPTPEQVKAFAQALGCTSYLTADVDTWRSVYRLTTQSARVRFVVSAHAAGGAEALWSAAVEHVAELKSEREVAMDALRETFRRLRQPQGKP